MCGFYHISLTLGLSLIAVVSVFAQLSPSPSIEMAWDGNRVVVLERGAFCVYRRDLPEGTIFPCPPSTIDHRFVAGEFWIAQEDTLNRQIHISRSGNARVWEWTATWTYPQDGLSIGKLFVYPLQEGHFILIERKRDGFIIDGKIHIAVVAKVDDSGQLRIVNPLDFGTREPLLLPGATTKDPWRFNPRYIWAVPIRFASKFITVPDSVFLFFDRVGAFLEYDLKGKLRRTIWLHSGLDEKRASDYDSYDWATLSAQPTFDGRILIASRSTDAVLNGRTRFPRSYNKSTLMGTNAEATRELDRKALEYDPRVEWWTLEPSTGKLTEAAPPDKVPSTLDSIERVRQFVFRFDPFGNLVFPYWNKTEPNPIPPCRP